MGKTPLYALLLAGCICLWSCQGSLPSRVGADAGSQNRGSTSAGREAGTDEGIAVSADDDGGEDQERTEYIDGSGRLYSTSRGRTVRSTPQGDGIELQFRDASLSTVLDAVLVDSLGLRYQLDSGLTATLTLETRGPVSADQLLFILEIALKSNNIAMVDVGGLYRVVPLAAAPRAARLNTRRPQSGRAGYTVQVVPLRYAVPSELRTVLENFAPPGGILAAADARSLLILAGTGDEIDTMLTAVDTFDIDWMAGMSFAMFDLQYAEAEEVTRELLEIFGDVNTPIGGAVRLIPIDRLNRILAISAQPEYLRDIEEWIERLDIGGSAPGRRIYVYHVQNGRAADLAATLNELFAIEPSTAQRDASVTTGDAPVTLGTAGQFDTAGFAQTAEDRKTASTFDAGQDTMRIVTSEENNSILLLATPSEFGVIESALKRMDEAPRQVLIEASLAEVMLTDELRYGVQWVLETGDGDIRLSEASNGGASPVFPGFSYLYTGSVDVRAVLNALESITDVNVVSSPKLLVLNNQSATLRVGDEVPVPVQSAISSNASDAPIVNTVEYRNTGVILEVTPRINAGGLIYLDIAQEVSDVTQTTSSGIDAPTIQQRKIESSVAVQSGETIALGGLIRETDSVTRAGVPFLQRIPFFGNAFGRTGTTNRRTELVVFLTPRVIRDAEETRDVMDYLRKVFENVDGWPGNE